MQDVSACANTPCVISFLLDSHQMNDSENVDLTLVASGGNEAEVEAADLQKQLAALLGALKESAKKSNRSTADQIRYKVQSLSTNSPAFMSLRGEPCIASDGVDVSDVHRIFNAGVDYVLGNSTLTFGVSSDWIKRMMELCNPIGKTIAEVALKVGSFEHKIGIEFKKKLSELDAKDFREKGSHIKGRLEQMNIHGKQPVFTIYPEVGSEKVRCIMPSQLIGAASKAFGKHVVMHGDLKYHWLENFPYEMKVSEIEFLGSQSDLPCESDIWGIAPDATGEKSTEEFISQLRDGE